MHSALVLVPVCIYYIYPRNRFVSLEILSYLHLPFMRNQVCPDIVFTTQAVFVALTSLYSPIMRIMAQKARPFICSIDDPLPCGVICSIVFMTC